MTDGHLEPPHREEMPEAEAAALRAWFTRSGEGLPAPAFTDGVMASVRRRERSRLLQRYAGLGFAVFGLLLLFPAIYALLERVAAIPLAVAAAGGDSWPLAVLVALALGWGLATRAGASALRLR